LALIILLRTSCSAASVVSIHAVQALASSAGVRACDVFLHVRTFLRDAKLVESAGGGGGRRGGDEKETWRGSSKSNIECSCAGKEVHRTFFENRVSGVVVVNAAHASVRKTECERVNAACV
jgi:hypothetical protein